MNHLLILIMCYQSSSIPNIHSCVKTKTATSPKAKRCNINQRIYPRHASLLDVVENGICLMVEINPFLLPIVTLVRWKPVKLRNHSPYPAPAAPHGPLGIHSPSLPGTSSFPSPGRTPVKFAEVCGAAYTLAFLIYAASLGRCGSPPSSSTGDRAGCCRLRMSAE